MRPSPGSSTASRDGCGSPGGPAGRSCCGSASTTSRARRARTRCAYPTASTRTILDAARALLVLASPLIAQRGITLVGVSVGNLGEGRSFQPMLPFEQDTDALDAALDEVRLRFGSAAVTRAVLLGRERQAMPLLTGLTCKANICSLCFDGCSSRSTRSTGWSTRSRNAAR